MKFHGGLAVWNWRHLLILTQEANSHQCASIEKPALGTTQLLEFEGSNSVTIVRSLGLIDTFGGDDFVSGLADAHYMKFRHSDDYERLPRVTDFEVYRSEQLIRSVLAHTGESRSQQKNWTFIEYDQPLSWEGPDPYSKGRLTGHQLVKFLQNLGLNFENFINHRHRKVIEFGPFIEGENLSQFQKEADVIAPPLSRLMSDDFFEQYADEDFEKTDIDRTKLKTTKFKD